MNKIKTNYDTKFMEIQCFIAELQHQLKMHETKFVSEGATDILKVDELEKVSDSLHKTLSVFLKDIVI